MPPTGDWAEELSALARYRSTPSARPLRRLLHLLGHCSEETSHNADWLSSLDAIKITGSNGKGSVATWTAAILAACDVRCGLFTSPHLLDFSERFVVDGEPLDEPFLQSAWMRVQSAIEHQRAEDLEVLAFEAITAVAVEAFAAAGVDTVVAEAGIGGRDDATRLLPGHLSALVSVDLEHVDLLGDDLWTIAQNKADIAAPGSILMLGDLDPALSQGLLRRGLEETGVDTWPFAPGIVVERLDIDGAKMVMDLRVDGVGYPGLRTSVLGAHQAANCGLAIRLARQWLTRHRPRQLESSDWPSRVARAVAGVTLPARTSKVRSEPPWVIDNGHTPAAVACLAKTLPQLMGPQLMGGRRWVLVAGVSADKSPSALLAPLLPPECTRTAHLIACRASQRGGDPRRVVAAAAAGDSSLPCEIVESVDEALARAEEISRREDLGVVVVGGLFLAAEALAITGKD